MSVFGKLITESRREGGTRMVGDFPRTLSLLRQEKKISQRQAAAELEVSQALLSHYENGVREPGLSFVVRASDYYGVSADFLLGRTMLRDGSAIIAEQLDDASESRDNVLRGSAAALLSKKLMVNATALFFDLIAKGGSRTLIKHISDYFSLSLYKAYRLLYLLDKDANKNAFSTPDDYFSELCDVELKRCEAQLRKMAAERGGKLSLPPLATDKLQEQYPQFAPSLLSVLHNAGERISKEN